MITKILKGLWKAVVFVLMTAAYLLLYCLSTAIFIPIYFFVMGCPIWFPILCIPVLLGEISPWWIPISLAGLAVALFILGKMHMLSADDIADVWGKPLRTDSWGRILPEKAKRKPRKRKPKSAPEKAAERESGKGGGNGDAA